MIYDFCFNAQLIKSTNVHFQVYVYSMSRLFSPVPKVCLIAPTPWPPCSFLLCLSTRSADEADAWRRWTMEERRPSMVRASPTLARLFLLGSADAGCSGIAAAMPCSCWPSSKADNWGLFCYQAASFLCQQLQVNLLIVGYGHISDFEIGQNTELNGN